MASRKKAERRREAAEAAQKARAEQRKARAARGEVRAEAKRDAVTVWRDALRGVPVPREMRVFIPELQWGDRARSTKLLALLERAEKKARKTLEPERFRLFWVLAGLPWVRPIEDWRPKGKAPRRKLQSLLDHTLGHYPVPAFLYSVLDEREWGPLRRGLTVFAALAGGESPRALVKDGRLPAPLTRRMCALFLAQKAHLDLVGAVRHAQVQGFGGDRRLAEAVCATPLGLGFADEAFVDRVLVFLAAQSMLDPRSVGPLVDFIQHRRDEDPRFSLKGRTVASLSRDMDAWHRELQQVRRVRGAAFEPSGLRSGRFEEKHKGRTVIWTVTELLFANALVDEGRALKHCVYSYASAIERGRCSIWSLRKDGERRITIEVHSATGRVVQARGACNRDPDEPEMGMIQRWADVAGLEVRLPGW